MDSQFSLLVLTISIVSMVCQLISWWSRIPSILFFLVAGLILGPIAGIIYPDKTLGPILNPFISFAVAIILFEGSLTLKIKNIKYLKHYILSFISLGTCITFLGVAFATYFIFNVDPRIALLIGAILTVTGPTVIMPMLDTIQPNHRIREMLRWEGIILDPFGAILAVLIFDIITSAPDSTFIIGFLAFLQMVSIGLIIGLLFGTILIVILNSNLTPKYLTNVIVLNFVLVGFIISNYLFHETGLLTVTIMGMTLSNHAKIDTKDIAHFKEILSTLLLSGVFIILAARIDLMNLVPVILPSLLLFLMMQVIIRPLKVFTTTHFSDLSLSEKILLIWIAPRGIVAVAIASLFQIKLVALGYKGSEFLVSIIFLIIVWSVILPSLTGKFIAKILGVQSKDVNGILILGSNRLSNDIGHELTKQGLNVIFLDDDWQQISKARMSGFKTFFGNMLSKSIDQHVDVKYIDKLLCLTASSELATLSNLHFKNDIEKNNIYYIQSDLENNKTNERGVSNIYRGTRLFKEGVTYQKLIKMLHSGYKIKTTVLSEVYNFDRLLTDNDDAICLFSITNSKLQAFTPDANLNPKPGDAIIYLSVQSK